MTILFPERLRELRTRNGNKQSTLAKLIHRSPCSISNYENGINSPDLETLVQIADFYGVSTDYLLGRTNFPSIPNSLPKVIYGQYTVGRFLHLLGHLPEKDRKFLVYSLRLLESVRQNEKE